MKFKSNTIILLNLLLVFAQLISPARGQADEYEYYYEDELTSTVAPAMTTTTTTTTTTTKSSRTTTAARRKPTRKGSQTIVAGPGKNGKQIQQSCSMRACVGYQYGRPDVVFNVIADMYDLQAMLPNRRYGGMPYMAQNKEYVSRFEQPFAYWYGPRQPSKPVRRQQPVLIDYGIARRPGLPKEPMYGYDDGGDMYTDYYDYEYADYDYPAKNQQDAATRDSNRLFVNFILNALGPRRSN